MILAKKQKSETRKRKQRETKDRNREARGNSDILLAKSTYNSSSVDCLEG
jgi:hypothetical protein